MENFPTNSNILSFKPKYDDLIVIIPAYNEESFIGSHILKLKKYTKTIILVDDASKDETINLAKYLLNPDHIIENNTNVGFLKTVKIGLNQTKNLPGQYILILPILTISNIHLIDEVMEPLIKKALLPI